MHHRIYQHGRPCAFYDVDVWLRSAGQGVGPSKACLEKLSGSWVFRDTRLPVAAGFENLEDGITIDELEDLEDGLTRDQVKAVLDFAVNTLAVAQTPTLQRGTATSQDRVMLRKCSTL